MAAGEYVSVRTQREMYEYQIALERDEVAEYPEEEAEELALIYEARGVDIEQAREVSRSLLSRPEQALDVLAREELGLNPDDLGSPWQAATASFLAFAVGRWFRWCRSSLGAGGPRPYRHDHAYGRSLVCCRNGPQPVHRSRRSTGRPPDGAHWRRCGHDKLPGREGARSGRRLNLLRLSRLEMPLPSPP